MLDASGERLHSGNVVQPDHVRRKVVAMVDEVNYCVIEKIL